MNALLITGTDTATGKTVVTTALAAYWQKFVSRNLGIMKPIQAGSGDRQLYLQLFTLDQSLDEINPLYFEAPLAPPIAAAKEGRTVDLGLVWQKLQQLQAARDWVLVEALGGLGSPVTYEFTVADLAAEWRLPTVLVVPVKLGSISQAVANVALARLTGVTLKGIILNCVQPVSKTQINDLTPIDLIQSLTNIPVLGCLPYLDNPTDLDKLAQVAANLDLERLMPFTLSLARQGIEVMQLALKHLISPDVLLTISPGQSILLENVTWQAFEALLIELGNSRAARIAYDKGVLEIMAPLPEHEYYKEAIADLIKDLAEALEIDYATLGSTTWKRPDLLAGVEPDNCFYLQNEPLIRGKLDFDLPIDPPPDLVLEIDITHKSLNRLPIYAQLGVPELWRYEQRKIKIYQLQNNIYVETTGSLAFPQFPIEQITPFIQSNRASGTRNMRLAFRNWVKQISLPEVF